MMGSGRRVPEKISKFAIFLGALSGFMSSFGASRHQISEGFLNNLADALLWGCAYWGVLFVCKFSLAKIDFFNNFYGPIGIKSALWGFVTCVITYLAIVILISIF